MAILEPNIGDMCMADRLGNADRPAGYPITNCDQLISPNAPKLEDILINPDTKVSACQNTDG